MNELQKLVSMLNGDEAAFNAVCLRAFRAGLNPDDYPEEGPEAFAKAILAAEGTPVRPHDTYFTDLLARVKSNPKIKTTGLQGALDRLNAFVNKNQMLVEALEFLWNNRYMTEAEWDERFIAILTGKIKAPKVLAALEAYLDSRDVKIEVVDTPVQKPVEKPVVDQKPTASQPDFATRIAALGKKKAL